jgi:hypothetical protein
MLEPGGQSGERAQCEAGCWQAPKALGRNLILIKNKKQPMLNLGNKLANFYLGF